MALDPVQNIMQRIRLLPALARECKTSFTKKEISDFEANMKALELPADQERPAISKYEIDFTLHVFDVQNKQIDELDAHCNEIYLKSLDIARDEEYKDIYDRSKFEAELLKASQLPNEHLAVDLAIGASFFTKGCKILHDIQTDLTKKAISDFGELLGEGEILGNTVLETVSKGKLQKLDLLLLMGDVSEKLYGENGVTESQASFNQLKEIFTKYGLSYKLMLVSLTKDLDT